MSTMTNSDEQTFSSNSNPAVAAAMAAEAFGGVAGQPAGTQQPQTQRAPEPKAAPPPDTHVELPAGYYDVMSGEVLDTAEVRELTGADEEALARVASSMAKVLETILQRGTVSVGGRPAGELLDGLLSGDRDALVVAIRTATYGPDLEYERVTCPACAEVQPVVIDLRTDVPSRPLKDGLRTLQVPTKRGMALVNLPTGSTQRQIMSMPDTTTVAESNTALLAATVTQIGETAVYDARQVREGLGVRDRRALLKAIAESVPGPQLGEVSKPCRSCGEQMPLPLSLADLFRG